MYYIFAGKTLLLGIDERYFAKKELKTLAFPWKSLVNLLLINNGGMTGTLLPM